MKIGDILLGELGGEDADSISSLIYRYNDTTKSFPTTANIGELFRHQVQKNPQAIAIIDRDRNITYAELDLYSDRIAHFIQFNGLKQGDCVGAFFGCDFWLVATLLGTLKAGAVYLPLNTDLPDSRLRNIIDQTSCRLLVSISNYICRLNSLQYECSSVKTILCLDSYNITAEAEAESLRMNPEIWDYTATTATTAIEASGWRHGFGGLVLTEVEIDEYLDNIEYKLKPYLHSNIRLLEIGCGSGLIMRRLAPQVGEYVGIDLASSILAWSQKLAEKDRLTNVHLLQLAAHELESLDFTQFDVVVIASVVQSFPGLNYLRQILTASLAKLKNGGIIFCSHIWNPLQRKVFIDTVGSEAVEDSLFVHSDFWRDWQAHQARVQQVNITPLHLPETSTLGRYSYDVLLHTAQSTDNLTSNVKPLKMQFDQRFLETLDKLPSPKGGHPEAPAYIIFTSGSTGHPKGVKVKTRSLINLLYWYQDLGSINFDTNLIQVISSNFDASIKNYLAPLLFGGKLILFQNKTFDPQALLQAISHHHINILNPGVPNMFYPVLELAAANEYRDLESLKLLALGGEAPIMKRLRSWLTHSNCHAEVVNIYGPTECTDIALCHQIRNEDWQSDFLPPIGKPLPNIRAYILDDRLNPQVLGAIGDLYLAGEGLGIEYLGNPEKTAQAFIPDPFFLGQLMYRTGDLAYRRTDGSIVYSGRCDNQLKIRGVRIELEEIEAVLSQYLLLAQNVVVAREDSTGDKRLVAYLVPALQKVALAEQLAQWQSEYISDWQSLYERIYSQGQDSPADLTFNITGWNSSYTRQPIPASEMREWVENTVSRILAFRPERGLEIGCGTGLLLSRVAKHCLEYWATDYSQAAIHYVEQVCIAVEGLEQVKLLCQTADNFEGIAQHQFDTVVLNSIIQYFPSVDYLLEVLVGAINVIGDRGQIFVGDVRSLPLLEPYHAAVQLVQASDSKTVEQWQQQVRQSVAGEEELVIDPTFFLALKQHFPKIAWVEIQPKRGLAQNELTQFRYDVTLHLESVNNQPLPISDPKVIPWFNWQLDQLSLTQIQAQLLTEKPELLGVHGIPNQRVEQALKIWEWVENTPEVGTVEQLKTILVQQVDAGINPEQVWQLANSLGYTAHLSWWESSQDGSFDVIFQRDLESEAEKVSENWTVSRLAFWDDKAIKTKPWNNYTNNPLRGKLVQKLVPKVREFLQQKLPSYMVPQAFVLLDSLPLTLNGKVDRKALPSPDTATRNLANSFVLPRNPIEAQLTHIWSEVLGLERIGVKDNFFELGGHSLLATQVLSRINSAFELDLSVQIMFESPTIAGIAGYIQAVDWVAQDRADSSLNNENTEVVEF